MSRSERAPQEKKFIESRASRRPPDIVTQIVISVKKDDTRQDYEGGSGERSARLESGEVATTDRSNRKLPQRVHNSSIHTRLDSHIL